MGTDNSCSVSGDVAMATLIAHSISVHAPIRTDQRHGGGGVRLCLPYGGRGGEGKGWGTM